MAAEEVGVAAEVEVAAKKRLGCAWWALRPSQAFGVVMVRRQVLFWAGPTSQAQALVAPEALVALLALVAPVALVSLALVALALALVALVAPEALVALALVALALATLALVASPQAVPLLQALLQAALVQGPPQRWGVQSLGGRRCTRP